MYENNPNVSEMVNSLVAGDSVILDGTTYMVGTLPGVLIKGARGYYLSATETGCLYIRSCGGRGRPVNKVITSFERVSPVAEPVAPEPTQMYADESVFPAGA